MKTLTMNDLKGAAKKYGAEVSGENEPDLYRVYITAPNGKVWIDGEVHALVADWGHDDHAWEQEEIENLLQSMEHGLEDCTEADCGECAS